MNEVNHTLVEFADFTFDKDKCFLRRRGAAVPLKKQSAQVLALLLRNAGEVVSRDEIRKHVWRNRLIEFDQGINACIRDIRQALGDNIREPRFVETHPRVGYRFLPAVRPAQTVPFSRRMRWPLAITAVGVAVVVLVFAGIRPIEPPVSRTDRIAVMPFQTIEGGEKFVADAARMTELLVLQLSQLQTRARVISTAELFGDDRPEPGMGDVSRWLEADYLLAGAVHEQDGVTTLSLRLVRTDGYVHLWSKSVPLPDGGSPEFEPLVSAIVAAMNEPG